MMRRRILCGIIGCASLLLSATITFGGAESNPPAKTPAYENTNVILISLQCLRPDHLGVYGYARDTSKNIDGLARTAVVFENAVSQANLTPVAQMSVFTSQYPRVHGMVSFEVSRDQVTQRTLPEILKYYGYTTAAAVSSPEFFMRYDTRGGTVVNPGDVFSRSFDTFRRTFGSPGGRSIRRLPTEALQWLKDNKDKKFFLWIASGLLHMPYAEAVPEQYKTRYDPPAYKPFWQRLAARIGNVSTDGEDPSYEIFSRVYRNEFYWEFAPAYRLTEDDVRFVNARYDAGVYYTDRFVGELMQLLESLHLTEKTLIVLQSIHGDDLGERGAYFHYDVNDTVIRDALVMRFPGDRFSGQRIPQQVQGIDIMPTVLDYLGIPAPHEAQGGSLLPLLRGDTKEPPSEYAFIERMPWWEFNLSRWYLEFRLLRGANVPAGEKSRLEAYQKLLQTRFDALDYPPGDIAIRTNAWKLILRKDRSLLEEVSWWGFITGAKKTIPEVELYDLANDPREEKNVAPEHPDVVARLKAQLLAWDAAVERRKARYRKNDPRLIIPYP